MFKVFELEFEDLEIQCIVSLKYCKLEHKFV